MGVVTPASNKKMIKFNFDGRFCRDIRALSLYLQPSSQNLTLGKFLITSYTFSAACVMKTVPSVYTRTINTIYLSHGKTVSEGTVLGNTLYLNGFLSVHPSYFLLISGATYLV